MAFFLYRFAIHCSSTIQKQRDNSRTRSQLPYSPPASIFQRKIRQIHRNNLFLFRVAFYSSVFLADSCIFPRLHCLEREKAVALELLSLCSLGSAKVWWGEIRYDETCFFCAKLLRWCTIERERMFYRRKYSFGR